MLSPSMSGSQTGTGGRSLFKSTLPLMFKAPYSALIGRPPALAWASSTNVRPPTVVLAVSLLVASLLGSFPEVVAARRRGDVDVFAATDTLSCIVKSLRLGILLSLRFGLGGLDADAMLAAMMLAWTASAFALARFVVGNKVGFVVNFCIVAVVFCLIKPGRIFDLSGIGCLKGSVSATTIFRRVGLGSSGISSSSESSGSSGMPFSALELYA